MTTPRRDRSGRFVARTRRNPDGAGYLAGGKFHPIRSWAGYNAERAGETPKVAPKRERRPKVGTPEERRAKARELAQMRTAGRRLRKEARHDGINRRMIGFERPMAGPATDKQRAFIISQITRRGYRGGGPGRFLGMPQAKWDALTKQDASDLIKRLG